MNEETYGQSDAGTGSASFGVWHHDRSKYADWGWVRDDQGRLVANVSVPPETDEAKHRREKTDPTQGTSQLIAVSP